MNINNEDLIKLLYRDFEELQLKLVNKPVLGAPRWHMTNYKILDDNGLIEINMEDGHIENNAIVQYSENKKKFEIIKEDEAT